MAASCGTCDLNFVEPEGGPEVACSCWREGKLTAIVKLRELIRLENWEQDFFTSNEAAQWDHMWDEDPPEVNGLSSKEIYGLFR